MQNVNCLFGPILQLACLLTNTINREHMGFPNDRISILQWFPGLFPQQEANDVWDTEQVCEKDIVKCEGQRPDLSL